MMAIAEDIEAYNDVADTVAFVLFVCLTVELPARIRTWASMRRLFSDVLISFEVLKLLMPSGRLAL